MLNELLNNLQGLNIEVDNINNLPKEQQEAAIVALAEKLLYIIEDTQLEVPIE